MIRAADLLAEAKRAGELGGGAAVSLDWSHVAERIRTMRPTTGTTRRTSRICASSGVDVVRGALDCSATARSRQVDGATTLPRRSRGIVIATGTDPAVPDVRGLSDTPYETNRDVVRWETLPETVVVLGGGPIGVELAQVWARFGVEVTLLEMADRLLPSEEPEAGEIVAEAAAGRRRGRAHRGRAHARRARQRGLHGPRRRRPADLRRSPRGRRPVARTGWPTSGWRTSVSIPMPMHRGRRALPRSRRASGRSAT